MVLGAIVTISGFESMRSGPAYLVAIIGKGSRPLPVDVERWYGRGASIPKSAYSALSVDRYIFERSDSLGQYVVIPEKLLDVLITVD